MNNEIIRNKLYDKQQILSEIAEKKIELEKKEKAYKTACEVQVMYQKTVSNIQNTLKGFIDEINQRALDITFPGYKFTVDFTVKNDVTHAGIYVENNGRKQKPLDSNGGGLGNIIAMCSQMGCKKMSTTRDVIFADQPMADLSKGEKEERAMEMLKKITEDMGIQYIMISHVDSQIDAGDKVISVSMEKHEDTDWKHSVLTVLK